MVRAWRLNIEEEIDTTQTLDLDELKEETGVLYWKLSPETYKEDGRLDQIKKQVGYCATNEIDVSPEALPDYKEKVKAFHKEHYYKDEQIRFALNGSAYFDVRNNCDDWIRIELYPGDLIVLPPGLHHRLTLIEHQRIKMLLIGGGALPPGEAQFRFSVEDLIMDCRKRYLESKSSSS